MKYGCVAVAGLGLIGGSVCRAIKKSGVSEVIFGIDTDKETLEFALKNRIIDRGSTELDKVVDPEFVVVATYVEIIPETVEKIIPQLSKGCVITDVGSVKSNIVSKVEGIIPENIYFVGSHPVAGTESSGIECSDAEIFSGKKVIVTPTERTAGHALDEVGSFWESIGCGVISLDPKTHDKVFAYVSHLPHAVAYSLINAVGSANVVDDIFSYSGGGLKDYTRIAASSPGMWKTIFLENKDSILESIKVFKGNLEKAESAIRNENLNELTDILEQAQKLKLTE